MKYTKSYPIHPKPDKQFSGASIFADGGPKTKTYTNKAEYDKALQAYNDSLYAHNKYKDHRYSNPPTVAYVTGKGLYDYYANKPQEDGYAPKSFSDAFKRNISEQGLINDMEGYARENDKKLNPNIDPQFYETIDGVGARFPFYKKPVVKPEYKEAVKQSNKQGNTYADSLNLYNNTQQSIKAFEKDNWIKSQDKDWITYTDPNDAGHNSTFFNHPMPIGKQAKGTLEQEVKPTMAQGTMESEEKPLMMPNGSKMLKQDFINKYSQNAWMKATGQKFAFGGFKYPNGGSFYDSSNINTSKPQVNTVPSSYTDQFSGKVSNQNINSNNVTDTSALVGNTIGQVGNTVSLGVSGNYSGMAASGLQAVASGVDAGIPDKQYKTGKTRKSIGETTLSRAGTGAAIGSFAGPWGTLIGGVVGAIEGVIEGVVTKDKRDKEQRNWDINNINENSLKDQQANNFSAFGGYKNKFPYGGNMKSEVTGQSYLKDQVSDFTSNKFSKHEQGGVMVDSQNEVEAGEIIYKDYVFSERLKDSNGKSFAERAKKLISQIK